MLQSRLKQAFRATLPEETMLFGERLAKNFLGKKIFLFGDLGIGKTTFLKGLAKGLKIRSKIKSPTFVGEHVHKISGNKRLLHLDLYRKESLDVESTERLKEIFQDKNLTVVVEWSERLPCEIFPEKRTEIRFQELKNEIRKITITEKQAK